MAKLSTMEASRVGDSRGAGKTENRSEKSGDDRW
jgi:hypothetical protein